MLQGWESQKLEMAKAVWRISGKEVRMMSRRNVVFVLAAAAVALTGLVAATPAETPRTVYISAIDSKGAPITDLTAADLVVKEGGKDYPVTSVQLATTPMDLAILVEDNGSGIFQPGVLQILQAIGERAKFSITQFSPQMVKILDFGANDINALQGALDKIGRRGKIQGDGEQLLQGISQTARELQQRKGARRVIVVLTTSGEGQTRNPDIVMNELQASGVMLNVAHLTGAKIGLVTGDGPKQSGGRIEQAGSDSAVLAAITKITNALANQYAVNYTLPDGVKPSDRLSVSTTRKGVSILAPTRIPDK